MCLSICTLFKYTLPQGERQQKLTQNTQQHTNFNPRSHKGNDDESSYKVAYINISIHVPTRGTTIWCFQPRIAIGDFNPRSHKGNDQFFRCEKGNHGYFNPRSHKGNDSKNSQKLFYKIELFYAIFRYFSIIRIIFLRPPFHLPTISLHSWCESPASPRSLHIRTT